MPVKYAFIFTLSLLLSSPVYAVEGYIGLGVGQSEINQGLFGEYGDGFKLFGGAGINKNLAIEAAYLDFGNPSENIFGVETQYEARAIGLWAKGLWPVTGKTELFGKVGLANWKIDKTTTVF
ncbi:MAG: outer membrane beta-barrel protein [Gammaproteobacteria bacterium]